MARYKSRYTGAQIDAGIQAARETIPAQLTQIGSKIGDLAELETTDKSDLVSAINEVKQATEGISSSAADTTYVDNQGLGSTNVQGALDAMAQKVLSNLGGAFVPFADAVNSVTGKYVTSAGKVASSSTSTNTVAYYAIPSGINEINVSIPKTGNNGTYPVSLGNTSTQTTGLHLFSGAGNQGAKSYTLQKTDFSSYAYLVINYNSAGGTPTIEGKTEDVDLSGFAKESDFEGIEFQETYTQADCVIGSTYIAHTNGNEASGYSGFFCSDFIEMPLLDFVVTSNYTLNAAALVAFYDENKTYIGYLSGASARTDYSYTAPSAAKYMRLTCKTNTTLSVSFSATGGKALVEVVKQLQNGEGGASSNESANILWIGNSFTGNATDNIGTILTNLQVDNISINKIQQGGTGFTYWNSNFSTTSYTTSRVYGNAIGLTDTLENILKTRSIDIIVIQQVSSSAGNYNDYVPDLASLIYKIRLASVNKNIKIAVAMVWGTYQSSFANIVSATKQMLENHNYIDYLIPLGTALESARISSISEGYNGFSSDENIWHLANGFGEYLASCAFYQSLCERFTHIPITEDTTTISVSGGLGELAVTAENRGLAHTAAINASILKYTPISLDS